jgi:hypothetical protein
MNSRFAATGAVALLAAALACGGTRSPDPSASPERRDAFLEVTNEHLMDVTIYALRGGMRQRLGTVSGFKSDTIALGALVGTGTLRLLVEPLASNERHVTEPLTVSSNEWIQFTIRSPLNLSSLVVRHTE